MRLRSIGARLTVRYAAAFACALVLLGGSVLFIVRQNLYEAIDDSLRDRLEGIRRFIEEHDTRLSLAEVKDEFRAHGDYFQVSGPDGDRIYQAKSMEDVAPLGEAGDAGRFEDVTTRDGIPLRLLSQGVVIDGHRYSIQVAVPLQDLEHGLGQAVRVLLAMFPIVLLLASAAGYWMSRRALAPVDEIAEAARSITADRLSDRLTVPKTGDELERLSRTLNGMIGRLESAFEKVSQFTSDASHELRTPLAVMKTTAEVALRSEQPAVDCRDALEHIVVELDRTSHLVDNLLLIAKADSGDASLNRRPVDLVEAVGEACAEARVLARVKGVEIEALLPEDPIWVTGDAHSLRRLFLILIDNAIKYTPAGGRSETALLRGDGFAIGTVRDSGVGIAEEHLSHIFDRFYRVDRARSREDGTGLGLAIGRWIAEAHGGRISVESVVGRGSLFRVEIPLL